MYLCLVNVPSPPLNLRAVPSSTTSVRVSWVAPEHPYGDVLGYKVYYYGSAIDEEQELSVTGTDTTLIDLKKYHEYSVRVAAVNANGVGISTDEVMARTFSDCKLALSTACTLMVIFEDYFLQHHAKRKITRAYLKPLLVVLVSE